MMVWSGSSTSLRLTDAEGPTLWSSTLHICSTCSLNPFHSSPLFPDIALSWECQIYYHHHLFFSLSITSASGWLVSSCLSVRNLRSHIWALLFSPTFTGVSHWDLGRSNLNSRTDVPIHYSSYTVMPLADARASLHLAKCYHLLYCLQGIFAEPVLGVMSALCPF